MRGNAVNKNDKKKKKKTIKLRNTRQNDGFPIFPMFSQLREIYYTGGLLAKLIWFLSG